MVYLCIQMIKDSWLCMVVFVLLNIKRQKEGKESFDGEGLKVFISKMVLLSFLATAIRGKPEPELCFLPGRLR